MSAAARGAAGALRIRRVKRSRLVNELGGPLAPSERWIRQREHDRRIRRGDDFAGDAWCDTCSGALRYVVPGHRP